MARLTPPRQARLVARPAAHRQVAMIAEVEVVARDVSRVLSFFDIARN